MDTIGEAERGRRLGAVVAEICRLVCVSWEPWSVWRYRGMRDLTVMEKSQREREGYDEERTDDYRGDPGPVNVRRWSAVVQIAVLRQDV